MPTTILALAGIVFLALFVSGGALPAANNCQTKPRSKPNSTSTPWPNLDKLNYLNPTGPPCGLEGTAHDAEEAAINRLMNRYHLPDSSFEETTLESFGALPQGDITDENTIINFPMSDSADNQRAVSVIGYVTKVAVLGCGRRSDGRATLEIRVPSSGVESANCNTNQFCNTQIVLTTDSKLRGKKNRNLYFVEVTERSRRLAREGRLVSNIGNNWSTEMLRKKLMGRWARFSGWLFFDPKYRERAWITDPQDKIGKPNTRQTAWEIHPVMAIEVLPHPKPKSEPTRIANH